MTPPLSAAGHQEKECRESLFAGFCDSEYQMVQGVFIRECSRLTFRAANEKWTYSGL